MISKHSGSISTRGVAALILAAALIAVPGHAGVSRVVQERYRGKYENKALFLKLPLFSDKQYLYIAGKGLQPEAIPGGTPARMRVGDQVRVLGLDFGRDEIKFKVNSIKTSAAAEIIFKFDTDLEDSFPNSGVFDSALDTTFTEGLQFADLEEAKRTYVEQQFEIAIREIANTGSTSRDFVLRTLATRIPAVQDSQRDVENLKARSQELTSQISQAQSDNRKLEAESRQLQGEITRLRSQNASLQEKFESNAAQLGRINEDLRTARGQTQSYQSQLANLQRSLDMKVDEQRDLTSQITDLGQTMRRLHKENETLVSQNGSLRTSVQNLEQEGKRMSGEIEDQKSTVRQLRETIETLSSKEDSLARQYLQLKKTRENLENVTGAVESLNLRILEEKSQAGVRLRKVQVLLRDIAVGTIEARLPENIPTGETKTAEVRFSSESIDYVRINSGDRPLLRSLGERLKIAIRLSSPNPAMEVEPERDDSPQEIGERDSANWRYRVANRGAEDTRLQLGVYFINKNADEIPVLREEHLVQSASMARQVRGYLQPIPLSVGAVMGFLLFGIVGVFRKGKRRRPPGAGAPGPADPPAAYVGHKRL